MSTEASIITVYFIIIAMVIIIGFMGGGSNFNTN